jgi:hypothetical protein
MPRLLPRFSLLTILLLTALVACGFTIWQLWREVRPLRAEVARLRAEVGQLTIEDTDKAYAIQVHTFDDDTWKWRIYLPPGRKYSLHTRSGNLPSPVGITRNEWLEAVTRHGVGSSSSGTGLSGEYTLEAKLVQQDDRWLLVTRNTVREGPVSGHAGGTTSIYPDEWLADRRARSTRSDVPSVNQKVFEPDQPILLLHMMKPIITETSSGYSSRTPEGPADGFALWIAPTSPNP